MHRSIKVKANASLILYIQMCISLTKDEVNFPTDAVDDLAILSAFVNYTFKKYMTSLIYI